MVVLQVVTGLNVPFQFLLFYAISRYLLLSVAFICFIAFDCKVSLIVTEAPIKKKKVLYIIYYINISGHSLFVY